MPVATVSQDLHHFDLKSLEGAWVKLRQLPYYEMLHRRDKGSIVALEAQQTNGRKRGQPQDPKMTIETLQTWEKDYMFKQCIAEHNLTDANDVPLDFNNPMTIKSLRPDIGMEIERLIDDLNAEGAEFQENFPTPATSSSSPETPELET